MRTITIITPSNIEIEYRLAGAGSRMGAFIIDFAIQITAILLIAWVILRGTFSEIFFGTTTPGGASIGFILISAFIIHFGYFILLEMLMNGQTIGKRILGLRVIRDNGLPIEFTHSLIRGVLRSSLDMVYIGFFVILFSQKHKRLGDMAAGTIVVSEQYNNNLEPTADINKNDGFF